MTDDIVTRLRERSRRFWKTGLDIPAFEMAESADEIERLRADRDKWQAIANRLGTHMGEALYGDEEWSCREYAISAYAEWERTEGAHLTKYQVEPQPRWYFKGGKEV